MNNSTVWSPPTATQRRSGPRRARSDRKLRAECTTWKSLKNYRNTLSFQCAPWMHRRCDNSVLCSCDDLGSSGNVQNNLEIDGKTDQKPREV